MSEKPPKKSKKVKTLERKLEKANKEIAQLEAELAIKYAEAYDQEVNKTPGFKACAEVSFIPKDVS
jgi:hypothetical protein